jgi:hypothetical protein
MAITTNTHIRLAPASRITIDRSEVSIYGNKTVYRIDYRNRKDYPGDHIKWCRRNMGERGVGWDFTWVSNLLMIEIWDDKLKFMYEMWKN